MDMVIIILIKKLQTYYKWMHMKAYTYKWELENDTKTDEDASLDLQTMVVLPPNLLECEASKCSHFSLERIHLKAPSLSRHARAHTYIK